MTLHRMLDREYGPEGDAQLRAELEAGTSVREVADEINGDHYWKRLISDASPQVLLILEAGRK